MRTYINLIFVLILVACTRENNISKIELHDIGLFNTKTAKSYVLYSIGNTVHLRQCRDALLPPIKTCASDIPEKIMREQEYLYFLDLNVGQYPKTEESLLTLKKVIAEYKKTGSNYSHLQTYYDNLTLLLEIKKSLLSDETEYTLFEKDERFRLFISPFDDSIRALPTNCNFKDGFCVISCRCSPDDVRGRYMHVGKNEDPRKDLEQTCEWVCASKENYYEDTSEFAGRIWPNNLIMACCPFK